MDGLRVMDTAVWGRHHQPPSNVRNSTLRLHALEASAASVRATSRSGAVMSQNPERYSGEFSWAPVET